MACRTAAVHARYYPQSNGYTLVLISRSSTAQTSVRQRSNTAACGSIASSRPGRGAASICRPRWGQRGRCGCPHSRCRSTVSRTVQRYRRHRAGLVLGEVASRAQRRPHTTGPRSTAAAATTHPPLPEIDPPPPRRDIQRRRHRFRLRLRQPSQLAHDRLNESVEPLFPIPGVSASDQTARQVFAPLCDGDCRDVLRPPSVGRRDSTGILRSSGWEEERSRMVADHHSHYC